MSEEQSKSYKVTLKGAGEREPWVTVEGSTEAELAFNVKDLVDKGTFVVIAEAASALRQATTGVHTVEQHLGGQVQQGPPPQQPHQSWPQEGQQGPPPQWAQQPQTNVVQGQFGGQQQQQPAGDGVERVKPADNDFVGKGGHWPPAGPRPTCLHGPRDWKSFVSKSGNLTEMWACPFDRRGAFIPPGQAKCDVEWADKR